MGSSVPAETPFAEEVALVRQYLEEEGKDPAHFPIAKRVYMAIDPDRKRASERLREFSARMYKDPDIAFRGSVYGSEEECAEGLAELAALDLDMIVVDLLYDQEEQIEQLAKEVLPKL